MNDKKTYVLSVGLRYARSLTDRETEGDKKRTERTKSLSPSVSYVILRCLCMTMYVPYQD